MQSGCSSVHGRASKVLTPTIATNQLGWKENHLSDSTGFWTSKLMLSWFACWSRLSVGLLSSWIICCLARNLVSQSLLVFGPPSRSLPASLFLSVCLLLLGFDIVFAMVCSREPVPFAGDCNVLLVFSLYCKLVLHFFDLYISYI